MTTEDRSLDAIYGILSESRRRYLLYYFLDSDHANIEELALQIAAWEGDSPIGSVSPERKQRVTTSLVHSHLPKLVDHGLVEYDGRTGDVVVADGFDELRDTISRAKETEDGTEITRSSTESFLYSDPLTRSSTTDRCQ